MKNLWNTVERRFPEEYRTGIFLALNILKWSAGTLIIGLLACTYGAKADIAGCVANVMCIAVYAGIIFGLFGGILFLMRHGGDHTSGVCG